MSPSIMEEFMLSSAFLEISNLQQNELPKLAPLTTLPGYLSDEVCARLTGRTRQLHAGQVERRVGLALVRRRARRHRCQGTHTRIP